MKPRDTVELALRNLRQARLRTFLTTLGVSIGIASLAGMVSLGIGLQEQFVGRFRQSGMFDTITVFSLGDRPGGFARATGAMAPRRGPLVVLDDGALLKIGAIEHVREVYPNFRIPGEVRYQEVSEVTIVAGVPLSARDVGVFQRVIHGAFFASESEGACLLSLEFARRLTVGDPGSLVGKDLTLAYASASVPGGNGGLSLTRLERKLRIAGILERGPGPTFGAGISPVMVPLEMARGMGSYDMFNPSGLLDQLSARRSYASVTVRVRRPQDTEEVEKRIKDMGYSAFSVMDALQGARRAFIILDILLGLVGSIALVVASLGIVNTMVMSILERTREIGVMKAVGGEDSQIRRIFLVEASAIGLAGGVFGILLGWLVGRGINFGANLYIQSQGGPTGDLFSLPWWLLLSAIGFSVLVSLVAGSYPASRAARLDPIRALRHD